ncbi:mitochondrial carrier (bou s-adenosylmethionine carrier) [Plasmopara halstedii]|uniref:Mitochondrial carrier (Bou s-adenosylmethionine carrier) n=1 Tax=Plasmopara halstedii TaxID=4781 RepID=A0A0P1ALT7_PLAHL|nr:mitochondrial carrier (bou s-adenosylmethionine carrier) [Plasmopara halstedii]CEG41959.1 mitochondrial carrier (bou s-adenosylmethionine carrier) [Plasmopara halstedii]|eukprot:XP_024578328.1 mitochondrial carrier (bou s-adenosylmethionine carrier) [Plasmopara halstedii]
MIPAINTAPVMTCNSSRTTTSPVLMNKQTATSAVTTASPAVRALWSGAVAGIVADSLLHPLEVINLRMKIQKQPSSKYSSILRSIRTILKEEGVRGYFGGLSTTLLASPVCTAMYFGTYETLKSIAAPHVSEEQRGMVYFLAGAMSEAIISAVSVPSEVIKSRLQLGCNPRNASGGAVKYTKNYRGTAHAAKSILRSEGARGLYVGYSACLSVETFFSAFSFLFYETLKDRYQRYLALQNKDRQLNSIESLTVGSLAGGIAAFLTNPLDVITVRLMTQGKNRSYTGFRDCLIKSVGTENLGVLWRGASCRIVSIMPTTGICFGVYETIKHTFFDGDLEDFSSD